MVTFENTASPLSELDIARVERRLGIRLPQDFKEHYLLHNGGTPRPRFFVKDGAPYEVEEIYPMNTGDERSSFEEMYVMMVDQTPEFPRGYLPFASDSRGDFFMYSLNPDSFGNIMFNQQDCYGDDDRFVVFLAPTLREFINSLTEEPDAL